jgi:hypothetical protein
MCYDYAIKQDGRYLSVDRQAYPVAQLDSSITSSPLDVLVYLKNKEADLPAEGIAIKSDVNNSRFTMTTNMSTSNVNGTTLIDRGTPDFANPLCAYDKNGDNATTNHGCTDGHDVRKGLGSLGSQEYIYFKYQLNPQEISGIFGDVNESLGLSIKYYTTAGGNKVEYPDYTLGGVNVPMCPPTVGYNPAWGQFNVVKRDSVKNNLVTQISRKPFDVDVIFDSSPSTGNNEAPTTTITTTVEVEMIDVGAFGDINASCANPDANVSKALLVPLTFTSGDYSDPVPTQAASYYNFALQNGAFRVWYYTDSNNTLIQNWTAATNAAGDVTSIAGNLYQSAHHSVCATACSVSTSATCYTCMKQNYAKPLCSRDNLSVRPEAFDIRIKDYTDNNSTILDVSRDVYGYSPDTTPTPGVKINLAAGYDYRYDIRATGNETNSSGLASVPRYTRNFNKDNMLTQQEYNASMVWRGPAGTACNATGSVDLSFYLIHGYKLDQTQHYDQVGEYDLSMIDKTWTAVDQITHNGTTINGFITDVDCVSGSNSSTLVGGKHGCEIGSAHTNGAHVYKNQEMYFKPAKFDISSYAAGLGLDNSPVGANPFVYMSNIGNLDDMNMSVRFTGNITAKGFNDTVLSNYVAGCYAKDLSMKVDHNASVDSITTFDARSVSSRLNDTLAVDSGKISGRNGGSGLAILSIGNASFAKDDNGSVKNVMRFNYDRNQTNPINPKTVHYGDLNVSYSVASDGNQSSMRADVNRSVAGIPSGTRTMNFDVTHAYGRVVPRGDINVFGFDTFATTAYYEVFNAPAMAGVTASILAPGTWFVNANHTEARDGNATISFIDPASGSNMTLGGTTGYANGVETYNFTTPFTIRQGYKAHIDTDAWLWHLPSPSVPLPYLDPNGPAQAGADNLNCLTHPCFNIIFRRSIGNTGSAKTESEAHKNNKNSTTSGTWSTTREYAPSSR